VDAVCRELERVESGDVQTMERAALTVGARAREAAGEIRGRVRIACLEEYAAYWPAPRLSAFRALYPEIVLEVLVGPQNLDLSRGEAELAIRTPRPREAGLVATRLGGASSGLYATQSLLRRTGFRLNDAASVRGVPLLIYTPEYGVLQEASWFQSRRRWRLPDRYDAHACRRALPTATHLAVHERRLAHGRGRGLELAGVSGHFRYVEHAEKQRLAAVTPPLGPKRRSPFRSSTSTVGRRRPRRTMRGGPPLLHSTSERQTAAGRSCVRPPCLVGLAQSRCVL
jgi:hypothetical protein